MADVNWITLSLGAFGGAVVGSITGFASNFYFTNRKERFDRQSIQHQRKADYHLKRRDHLARVISLLDDASRAKADVNTYQSIIDRVKKLTDPNIPEDLMKSRISDAGERSEQSEFDIFRFIRNAHTEAELYGNIPTELISTNQNLARLITITVTYKFFPYKSSNKKKEEEHSDHMYLLTRDLYSLMDYELYCFNQIGVKKKPECTITIPYLSKLAPLMPLSHINVDSLDFSHMKHYEQYRKTEESE